MNCRSFQNDVFEYLDGSLSQREREAAGRHLAQCDACVQFLRRQREAALALSERFHQGTAAMTLGPEAQRRILTALADQSSSAAEGGSFAGFWLRLAWIASATACLIAGIWLGIGLRFGPHAPRVEAARTSGRARGMAVSVTMSNCAPIYIFRSEGDFVIDSLTCQPRIAAQTLWLTVNHGPAPKEQQTPL